jgi:[citrate (pro-3S)-lyase] ligase
MYRCLSHLTGEGVSLKLLTELLTLAYELNRSELFLFTKPENSVLFSGAGFWPIAQAGTLAVLMENSSERLARFCRQLAMYRQPGKTIGAIVMNANPFTLGHRYLIEQAAARCDWLHLFVVKEDASQFRYTDRWALIEQGLSASRTSRCILDLPILFRERPSPATSLKKRGRWTIATARSIFSCFANIWRPRWALPIALSAMNHFAL